MSPSGSVRTFACVLDGSGGGRVLGDGHSPFDNQASAAGSDRSNGFTWCHIRFDPASGIPSLPELDMLDDTVRTALFAPETRPRYSRHDDGIFLNLRGVNLNPGSDPEDMVSIRLWATQDLVISVHLRQLMSVQDMMSSIEAGQGPDAPGALLAHIAFHLTKRMDTEIMGLTHGLDDLEELFLEMAGRTVTSERVADMRRKAVILHRYISPQRDALQSLAYGENGIVTETDRVGIRETADHVIRMVEELTALRERAATLQDQLINQRSETMNRTMLLLSIVTAVFLPVTFVTGLMGMNVGGIPLSDYPMGFTTISVLLVFICLLAIGIIRLWRLM